VLETTPASACGTQGFVPCVQCEGRPDCVYNARAIAIRDAFVLRKWPDGQRYIAGDNWFDEAWNAHDYGEVSSGEGTLDELNVDQRAAVEHFEGPVLVLAGAGSGKTRVLMVRIERLIARGVEPAEILALTFTRRAATEMRNRIRDRLGPRAIDLVLTTFHSLALGICRDHPDLVGRQKGFSVWDDKLQLAECRRIYKDLWYETPASKKGGKKVKLPVSTADLLDIVSAAKRCNTAMDDAFLRWLADNVHPVAAVAIAEYEATKKAANALDFDDLIWAALRLLQANPDVLAIYHERWRFVMVDEYQDTNDLQEQFLGLLIGEARNLMAVGDEDQAIYGFRGGNVDHILTFSDRYPSAETIILGCNYRSDDNILQTAARTIAHNKKRRNKRLWTESDPGWPVEHHSFSNVYAEAEYVARMIGGSIEAGYAPAEHCVMVRTRRQFTALQRALSALELPYVTVGAVEFWQRTDIRLILAWLKGLLNPADLAAGAFVLSHWPKLGAKTVETWKSLVGGQPMYDVLRLLLRARGYGLHTAKGQSIEALIETLDELVARFRRGDALAQLACWLYEVTGLDAEIAEAIGERGRVAEEGRARKELRTDFLTMCPDERGTDPFADLTHFLDSVLANAKVDDTEPKIVLSTIHSAKGLEWDHVWIVGCVEGKVPYSFNVTSAGADLTPDALEEERRLMYVAMTRARQRLVLTRYEQDRDESGREIFVKPSRFLIESLGPDRKPAPKPSTPASVFTPGRSTKKTSTVFQPGKGIV